MYLATRRAIYSAALSTEATATLMFLPSWNKRMTTSPYASLCRKFPHMCTLWGSIPSVQLQYAKVPFWNTIQTPLPKQTWYLQIIAIWNTKGRNCLKAYNNNWLKVAKAGGGGGCPEAKWEINCIHNDPYPSALSNERNQGLNNARKLPSDHLHQIPQGPQDKTCTLDPPYSSDKVTQHSSSPNLIQKVQDWRDWTYTDGSIKKHEEGQDTGSGVYHPCLNISH